MAAAGGIGTSVHRICWYIAKMSECGYRNQQFNARVVLKISILNIFINE
jgi:hypothetical protein